MAKNEYPATRTCLPSIPCTYPVSFPTPTVPLPRLRKQTKTSSGDREWRICHILPLHSRCRVRVGGELTDVFSIQTGLRQGCPLSCMLFNYTLEWVMRSTPQEPDVIRLNNGTTMDRLAFADDADLMGETFIGRDHQLANFNSNGKKVGLEVAESKTKVMKMAREERTEDFIELDEFLLEEVDQFRYLGSIVSWDNDISREISARISAASRASWGVNDIIKSKIISRRTKLQVYVTTIRPIATYACETWALSKELERRLCVFENGILRRIYGRIRDADTGEWRMRHNRELREISGLAPITSFVRAQRLRWAGHVARMPADNPARRALDGVPEGRRPPGRPRMRWVDCVRNDLTILGVDGADNWRNLAQDRRRWRLLVTAAKGHPGPQLQE